MWTRAAVGLLLSATLGSTLSCGSAFEAGTASGGAAGSGGSVSSNGGSVSNNGGSVSNNGGAVNGNGGSGGAVSSGGSASSVCPITPCGGNVVGTWQVTTACADWLVDPATTGDCPTAKSINNLQKTGTYTYGADGKFSWQVTSGGTTTVTLPASCIVGITACSALEAVFTPDKGYQSGKCTGTASVSCTCTAKLTDAPDQGSGMYTVSGTQLTAILGSDTSTSSYCVQGNRLTTQYATDKVVTNITATKL